MEKKFLAGFARADITPLEPVPLGGYGNSSQRMSEKVLDALQASCVAITDPHDNTVILVGADLILAEPFLVEPIKEMVEARFGIPKANILFNVSHSHSAPDLRNQKEPSICRYLEDLPARIVDGIQKALDDRQEITGVYAGDVEAEGLNFVRHYVLENGTYAGDNFGDFKSAPIAAHATEADPTMHLVKLTRKVGKDIVLANWRAHSTRTGWGKGAPAKNLSADYPYMFRAVLEAQADCHAVFLQGAAGNINASSRIKSENITPNYVAHGAKLAYYALKGLESNMKPITLGPIQVRPIDLELACNKPDPELAKHAEEVVDFWEKCNDIVATTAFGMQYGIRSPYQAGAQVWRAKLPDKEVLPLGVITMGDWAVAFAPNELFDTISVNTEAASPFSMTMTLGYTNGAKGYIPSAFGFEHTCYESDITRYAKGAGEAITDAFVKTLKELKNN